MGKSKKKIGTKQQLEYKEPPVKWHAKPVKCLNERQKEFINSIKDNDITFCISGPGAGKTMMAVWQSLRLIEKGLFKKLILVRSIRAVKGEELGALPGSMYEKMSVYLTPFFQNIDKVIGKESREALVGNGTIEILPLAYCRGLSEEDCIMIFDEAQNVDFHTFESIVTRIGKNCKIIICGDEDQSDFKNKSEMAPLNQIADILEPVEGIGVIRFLPEDSAIRNPIIPKILEKLTILKKRLYQKGYGDTEVKKN